jgi:CHRD domain
MNTLLRIFRPSLAVAVGAALLVAAGCASTEKSEGTAGTEAAVKSETAPKGQTVKVTLSGDNEVPPVKTKATGSGTITVGADKSVSGKVTTTGVDGTAAHIHDGAPGKNGPVIIPLTKSGNDWTLPAGAKLTDEQYKNFQAGNLYVNVHSAENKGGEIRGNLSPK